MRISDWSSDVCSSDLALARPGSDPRQSVRPPSLRERLQRVEPGMKGMRGTGNDKASWPLAPRRSMWRGSLEVKAWLRPSLLIPYSPHSLFPSRSEEHKSELQSLMRISYAAVCLKKKKQKS